MGDQLWVQRQDEGISFETRGILWGFGCFVGSTNRTKNLIETVMKPFKTDGVSVFCIIINLSIICPVTKLEFQSKHQQKRNLIKNTNYRTKYKAAIKKI